MKAVQSLGVVLALLAALFNGLVGLFSVNLFQSGLSPEGIAFYKCFISLFIIFSIFILTGKISVFLQYLKAKWRALIVCSFFGFFMLYFFETSAYQHLNVAVVVFLLFGVSTLVTFFFTAVIEKRNLVMKEWLSIIFAVIGLYLIFIEDQFLSNADLTGFALAVLAGVGYGGFLVLSKKLNIGGGLIPVAGLMLFGCLYLFFPFALQGLSVPSQQAWLPLLALALLPTIGGFWCTTKALSLLKSQTVQLVELSEPIFALLLAFTFLGQLISPLQMVGGVCILVAILAHEVDLNLLKPARMIK